MNGQLRFWLGVWLPVFPLPLSLAATLAQMEILYFAFLLFLIDLYARFNFILIFISCS